jgi:hypothetical protein
VIGETKAGLLVIVTCVGVHAMFILAQSDGVPSRRPKSVGTSARVKVTEVIDVEGDGFCNEKVNRKSLGDGPVPWKHEATTPSSVCEEGLHAGKLIGKLGSP